MANSRRRLRVFRQKYKCCRRKVNLKDVGFHPDMIEEEHEGVVAVAEAEVV